VGEGASRGEEEPAASSAGDREQIGGCGMSGQEQRTINPEAEIEELGRLEAEAPKREREASQ
jgi:hypothetical protein